MCPVCKTVVVRRVYRRHFETMHCVQDPVTCQFCQKVFKHRYSLDCHQRQTHPHQRVTSRYLLEHFKHVKAFMLGFSEKWTYSHAL